MKKPKNKKDLHFEITLQGSFSKKVEEKLTDYLDYATAWIMTDEGFKIVMKALQRDLKQLKGKKK